MLKQYPLQFKTTLKNKMLIIKKIIKAFNSPILKETRKHKDCPDAQDIPIQCTRKL